MASLTQWRWVWVDSRSWWWTGRPGFAAVHGLQRVRHDWATELNCTQKMLACHHLIDTDRRQNSSEAETKVLSPDTLNGRSFVLHHSLYPSPESHRGIMERPRGAEHMVSLCHFWGILRFGNLSLLKWELDLLDLRSGGHVCIVSHVWLSATPWTVVCQAPRSMGFSRQEYWSGLSFPSVWRYMLFLLLWTIRTQTYPRRRHHL